MNISYLGVKLKIRERKKLRARHQLFELVHELKEKSTHLHLCSVLTPNSEDMNVLNTVSECILIFFWGGGGSCVYFEGFFSACVGQI